MPLFKIKYDSNYCGCWDEEIIEAEDEVDAQRFVDEVGFADNYLWDEDDQEVYVTISPYVEGED